MRKLLSIALLCVAGMSLTGCESITLRHSYSRPVYYTPYVTQIPVAPYVTQPTLNCNGYGWHWTPSQGKHWHYYNPSRR